MAYRIEKPWGFEEVITLTPRYCFKRLFLKAGHRTSLQYHKRKHETLYFVSGKAWLEQGGEQCLKLPGEYAIIVSGEQHRIKAVEDTVYVEASTPEVGDVVRVQDDYGRA